MNGPSMLPTFSGDPSEVVLEEMITHTLFPNTFLNRGDLITFESPIIQGRLVCKRLIGMPGDLICVDPTGQYADPNEHIIIPKGHVWVCGDNLTVSRDSRMHGPVPMGLVKGRIVAKVVL
jgi:inner membrane protease subunit 1